MSDYSKSVIYKIYKEDTPEFYIGSTNNEKQRKKDHKSDCNNEYGEKYNRKVYKFMRENGGYDNWKYEVLDIYPCDNKIQLVIREQYYYDLLKPLLNTYRPYISEEELKEENKNYCSKYHGEHKNEIHKRNKQKHNCGCGGKFTTNGKSQHYKTEKHTQFIEKQTKNNIKI